jgi:hypothetical protein
LIDIRLFKNFSPPPQFTAYFPAPYGEARGGAVNASRMMSLTPKNPAFIDNSIEKTENISDFPELYAILNLIVEHLPPPSWGRGRRWGCSHHDFSFNLVTFSKYLSLICVN